MTAFLRDGRPRPACLRCAGRRSLAAPPTCMRLRRRRIKAHVDRFLSHSRHGRCMLQAPLPTMDIRERPAFDGPLRPAVSQRYTFTLTDDERHAQ